MTRVITLVAVAGILLLAVALPEPEAAPGPTFTGPETADSGATASSSVWYCVWQDSSDVRDASYNLASVPVTEAVITLPNPLPGQPPDSEAFSLPSPGARVLNVADVVRLGPSPGFVEYDDGPAGTSTIVTSDAIITGDSCVLSVSKLWQLPGGTTRDGTTMTLRLFNPFPELAKVTVSGISEFGAEPLPELEAIDVPGRSWRDFSLNEIVPFLDDLVLTVGADEGVVIPSIAVQQGAEDEASWLGAGLASNWYFPVAQQDELVPEVVIWNPGTAPVAVEIDAYTTEGPLPAVRSVEVAAGVPTRVLLDDVAEGAFGVHVRGNRAVSAVVVATSPADVLVVEEVPTDDGDEEPTQELVAETVRSAGTTGATELASSWLLPGAGAAPDAASSLWVMNSSADPITVTLQPLGVIPLAPAKITVDGGTLKRVAIDEEAAIAGYLIEATAPIAASWSASAPRGIAFMGGIPIAESGS